MHITQLRNAMAVTLGALALASLNAAAQAPQAQPAAGQGASLEHPVLIQRLALDDPALKLSAAQKGEIEKIVENLHDAVGKVLSEEQRAAWQAAQEARRMQQQPGRSPAPSPAAPQTDR